MVLKIIWSPEGVDTYVSILEYLEKEWTDKEVKNFITRVGEKLEILKDQPNLGRASDKRRNTYRTVINKQISLIYHYKPIKKEIELLAFWHTSRNPGKLKF